MKKTLLTRLASPRLALAILASSLLATSALAQTTKISAQTSTGFGEKTALFDKIAGKFTLMTNVGYVYNFANDWGGGDVVGKANGNIGSGARIGYTGNSGFGLSTDYLFFASQWNNNGFDINNIYHVVALTPSYRISFGSTKEWGLKLGLGVGFSLADVSWGVNTAAKAKALGGSRVAGGASYQQPVSAANNMGGLGTGNCGTAGNALRFYADSLGSASGYSAATAIGANNCESNGFTNQANGLSDLQIVNFLGRLPPGLSPNSSSNKVSYGVWRRIFATEAETFAGAGYGKFFSVTDAASATAKLESLNEYTTRCATQSCEGQVASSVGAEAAAAAVQGTTAVVACTALGGTYANGSCTPAPSEVASSGKAKDDAGFVLVPEIALEYDNGSFHADINARYIHELFNVKYDGVNGAPDQLQKSGPLAVFIGVGLGGNF